MFSIFQLTILVVSLLPLFLTFLTYCIFPVLRTLPAQNNMALVVCLFLAQLLLVIGSYLTTDTIICKIFGVLIHYSWLCVVFWMNVCSFHMFSVFRAPKARSSRSPKRMIKYVLYTNGLSLLIVVMVIALSLVFYGTIGYGRRQCYLDKTLLVGVAFILPLSLVIVCNLIFLSLTIFSINKTSKMASLAGKDRHHAKVYIKLSTVTGIFWTVDILSNFFWRDPLRIISTILNYSQGIFIFLSFMANRLIVKLWLGLFIKETHKYVPATPNVSNSPKSVTTTQLSCDDNKN
ncbi:latrophilin-like protein LAT-2 [Patella vulgata]|uniref:latrophilin-like protein LAT-2 n=1 Tax=Patella vulgata TaxID=6465 RepID=UPI0024A918BB|nr:latrophilin-like protein LAT-2 [Patella vulgata]